jgi:hypothetical protein
MANSRARKTQEPDPSQEPVVEPVRAREEDGTFKADDPSTPDLNEAYEPPIPNIKSKDVSASARPKVGKPTKREATVKGPTFGRLGVHTVSS